MPERTVGDRQITNTGRQGSRIEFTPLAGGITLCDMDPIEALAADIDARKLQRARAATMEEKLLDGPRLFRLSCEAIKAGLRLDHPDAGEEEIHQMLIERVYGRR